MNTFFPSNFYPMAYFITQEMYGFAYQFFVAQENATKYIILEEPGKLVLYFSHSMVLFSRQIHILWYTSSYGKCMGFLIRFPQPEKIQQNPSKACDIGLYTFSIVWVLFSIIFPSCSILHHMGMTWVSPSISHSTGKCSKIHWIERGFEVGTHTFHKVQVVLFHQIPILWYTLPHGKCIAFPINFPQYGKMQKSPPCELSGCFSTALFFQLLPKSGDSLKEQAKNKIK